MPKPLARLAAVLAVPALLAGCASVGPAPSSPQGEQIAEIVERHIAEHALRAVLVEVTIGDELVLSRAWGESMTGVPATTDMRFRNGAVAFAYLGHLLMQFVDAGTVGLDDTIDAWFPELPAADAVTLRMLANQTSGYPDFEKDPAWNAAYNDAAKVLGPLGLTGTTAHDSAYIPEPVLHAYTSERREVCSASPRASPSRSSRRTGARSGGRRPAPRRRRRSAI